MKEDLSPHSRLVLPVTAVPQMINMLQRLVQNMEGAGVIRRDPPTDAN